MNFLAPYSNLTAGVTKRDIEGSPEEESDYVKCSTGCGVETSIPDEKGRCLKCSRKEIPTLSEVEDD